MDGNSSMETFFYVLKAISAVLIGIYILYLSTPAQNFQSNRSISKTGNFIFSAIAKKLGFKLANVGMFSFPVLYGKMDDYDFFAQINKIHIDDKYLQVFEFGVRFNTPFEEKFHITKVDSKQPVSESDWWYESVESGDVEFDLKMETSYKNSLNTVVAILTYNLRKEVLLLAQSSDYVRISNDKIHIYYKELDNNSTEMVLKNINTIFTLTKMIMSYSDLRKLHIKNVTHDPISKVRLNCLKVLMENYPRDKEIDTLLKTCLDDVYLPIQFEAGLNLGAAGLNHILKIISKEKIADDKLVLLAVTAFGDALFKKSSTALVDVFTNYNKKKLKLEILKTFKKFENENLRSFLEPLLDHTDDDIVDGAVEALATCGNIQSVEKLLHRGGKSINPFFRSRVNESVLKIQSRFGSVEKGWLSVSELSGTEGELSLTDLAGEGSVSISEPLKKKGIRKV